MLVVDGGVKAEIVLNPFALFIGAGDSDHTAAVNLAELADNAAGGASSGGNNEGLAGLWFAYFEQAEVGGQAVDTEKVQEIGVGEEWDAGKFLECSLLVAGEHAVFLQTGETGNFVA